MPYSFHYSPRASDEFERIIHYVTDQFGIAVAEKVKRNYNQTLQQIAINPSQFPYFNKRKKIRKCVISPQTTLYYRLDENVVNLLSFRSNFMNPETKHL
jgi:plasmid stabilization system protein ParE